MALTRWVLVLAFAASACGGSVVGQGDGGDGGVDVGANDGSIVRDGAVILPCNTDGLKLCGGQCGQSCPVDKCISSNNNPNYKGELGVCTDSSPSRFGGFCSQCEDGDVCALTSELALRPTPIDTFGNLRCADERWALMYSLNGRNDLARYADRSTYTGALLPSPSTCPSVSGFQLCGGACGSCANGYVCMGRSPLHPYSLCVNKGLAPCERGDTIACTSKAGYRCLTFKVDPPSQPVADATGFCADRTLCEAAAQSYPGGVFCTGGL